MLGSDHTKYAEAMKLDKIKGIVLASATDEELNDIFRLPAAVTVIAACIWPRITFS